LIFFGINFVAPRLFDGVLSTYCEKFRDRLLYEGASIFLILSAGTICLLIIIFYNYILLKRDVEVAKNLSARLRKPKGFTCGGIIAVVSFVISSNQ
jgi:hypothetical protein